MLRVTELCKYSKDNLESIIAELRGYEKDYIQKANFGTFWHSWILRNEGRDNAPDSIEIIKASDYRTKEAREARDFALKNGKTPLLEKEFEATRQGIDFLKPALFEIFPADSKFEKEVSGNLLGADLVGHIDCLTDEKVIDLKVSEVSISLDKHIFDMRYNLQMWIYMELANRQCAELVFVNPKALIIQTKRMLKDELKFECETLVEKAFDNMSKINEALESPLILRSDYVMPQWAIAILNKGH